MFSKEAIVNQQSFYMGLSPSLSVAIIGLSVRTLVIVFLKAMVDAFGGVWEAARVVASRCACLEGERVCIEETDTRNM